MSGQQPTQFPLGEHVVNSSAITLWPKTCFRAYLSNMRRCRYGMICTNTFCGGVLLRCLFLIWISNTEQWRKTFWSLYIFCCLSLIHKLQICCSHFHSIPLQAFLGKMCLFQQTSSILPMAALWVFMIYPGWILPSEGSDGSSAWGSNINTEWSNPNNLF